MPLTPWKSMWDTRFPTLREEMDKVFEDFFGSSHFPSLRREGWMPPVDVHETKKDVVVTIDIPAVDPKDVSITVVEDRLTVKGERKREEDLSQEEYYRSERVHGLFQRTIQLPMEVVGDKARATYKDGVLKITVPKSVRVVPKEVKIEIK